MSTAREELEVAERKLDDATIDAFAAATCALSSRVGQRTSAPGARSFRFTRSSSGRPNAAVLPLPVRDSPTTSFAAATHVVA